MYIELRRNENNQRVLFRADRIVTVEEDYDHEGDDTCKVNGVHVRESYSQVVSLLESQIRKAPPGQR